jgi:O-antigen/teichoic acid export membrane protein
MSFLRQSTLVFAYRIVLVGVVFATDVVLARWFGPAGKGAVSLLTVTPIMLAVVAGVGLDYALNHAGHQRGVRVHAVFSRALLLGLGSAAVIGTVLLSDLAGVRTFLYRGVPRELSAATRWSFAIIPAEVLFTLGGMLAITVGRPVLFGQMRVVRRTLVLAAVLVAVGIFGARSDVGITAIVITQVGAIGFVGLAGAIIAGWRGDSPGTGWGGLARQGALAWPARLAERLQTRVDFVLLGVLASGAAVGVYSVGTALAEMLYFVTGSLSTVLFSHRVEPGRGVHHLTLRMMLPIGAALALVAGLAGSAIIPLVYGEDFGAGVPVLWLLLPGALSMSLVQIASPYLVQSGHARSVSAAQLTGLAVNLCLNLVLIPALVERGAAVASSVSYTLTFLIVAWSIGRVDGRGMVRVLVPRHRDWADARARLVTLAARRRRS